MNPPRKVGFHRMVYDKKKDQAKGDTYRLKKGVYKKREQLGED